MRLSLFFSAFCFLLYQLLQPGTGGLDFCCAFSTCFLSVAVLASVSLDASGVGLQETGSSESMTSRYMFLMFVGVVW